MLKAQKMSKSFPELEGMEKTEVISKGTFALLDESLEALTQCQIIAHKDNHIILLVPSECDVIRGTIKDNSVLVQKNGGHFKFPSGTDNRFSIQLYRRIEQAPQEAPKAPQEAPKAPSKGKGKAKRD